MEFGEKVVHYAIDILWRAVRDMCLGNGEFGRECGVRFEWFTFLKASFAEDGIMHDFHVSQEVTILGISLFVFGLGMWSSIAINTP